MDLNLYVPINKLGYGYASINIYKSLVKAGVNVALFPINPQNIEALPSEHEIIKEGIERAKFFNPDAPCVKIWHQHDFSAFIGRGLHVGWPIFELDTFSDLEKHQLSTLDKIVVCSEWAKSIITKHQFPNNDTHVVPLGVDTEIFKPNNATNSNEKTIFLNIGKWEVRKGHDVLIEMFNKAFIQEDNVELWMMCDNCFNTPEENEYWQNKYCQHNIKIIPRQVTQKDMVRLINKADVGIFPARSEGWNLEILEMMSCGKHIITTDYSGHTQYCNTDNSKIIAVDMLENAYDGKWFFNQGKWAKITDTVFDEFVNTMRTLHVMKQDNRLISNLAGCNTAKAYSWNNSVQTLLNIF